VEYRLNQYTSSYTVRYYGSICAAYAYSQPTRRIRPWRVRVHC